MLSEIDKYTKISALLLSEQGDNIELGIILIGRDRTTIKSLSQSLLLLYVWSLEKSVKSRVIKLLLFVYTKKEITEKLDRLQILKIEEKYYQEKEELVKKWIFAYNTIHKEYEHLYRHSSHFVKQFYKVAKKLQYNYKSLWKYALIYYEFSLSIKKNNADAWFNLGQIYHIYIKDHKKAISCYLSSLKYKKNAVVYNNLGTLYTQFLHDYEKGTEAYEKALEFEPSNFFYKTNLANVCLKKGDYSCFEIQIKSILSERPRYVKALNLWATYVWKYLKKQEKAQKIFLQALALYPEDAYLLGNYGELLAEELGYYNKALKYYKKSLRHKYSTYRTICLIELLVNKQNKLVLAGEYYQKLKQDENFIQGQYNGQLTLEQSQNFLKAIKKLEGE